MAARRDQSEERRRSASPRPDAETASSSKDESPIDARDDHGITDEASRIQAEVEDGSDEGEASEAEADERVITTEKDAAWLEKHSATSSACAADGSAEAPPLPDEAIPPLPSEAPPTATDEDDGWAPVWDQTSQAFYFYNRFTGATQWTNPRVPDAPAGPLGVDAGPPGVHTAALPTENAPPPVTSGYNPAIHGDYDPNAWYAQPSTSSEPLPSTSTNPSDTYAATAAFNRFTGRFQTAELTPENFNDENKSKRQMNAFFDVDAAANNHDGRSLKAERSGKKLTKTELKQFKEKRKAKKEEKRRAWLRD